MNAASFAFQWTTREGAACVMPLDWRAERLTWGLPGGPRQAWLRASLPPQSAVTAETALEWLRYGVLIAAQSGPAWWGWVRRVELRAGGLCWSAALDELCSRAAVQFSQRRAGVNAEGERCLSAWAEDALSRGVYGRKERLLSLGSLNESAALRARDAFLAANAAPQIRVNAAAPAEEPFIILECQGWWNTLAWVLAPRLSRPPGFLEPAQTAQRLGRGSSDAAGAQSFCLAEAAWLSQVGVDGKVMGVCGDGLRLEVCADSGGNPGAVLASAAVPAAQISGGRWEIRFTLPEPLPLTAGAPYWLKLSRSGALDTVNYYQVYREDTNAYPDGQFKLWNGSAWVTQAGGLADINFSLELVQPLSQRLALLAGAQWGGPFFRGVEWLTAPGGYAPLWKAAEQTCLDEVKDLLAAAGGWTARVSPARVLEVYAPAAREPAPLRAGVNGRLTTLDGRELPPGEAALGAALQAGDWPGPCGTVSALEWTPAGGLCAG
jgi:hypothetical protein